LRRIEVLDLYGRGITDVGLTHLIEITSLRELFLLDTRVTDAGIERFRLALPSCVVTRLTTKPRGAFEYENDY
jgi:hypothetical protein